MVVERLTDAAGVRRMVGSATSRRRLADVVERMAPGEVVDGIALTRCTFKPGRNLRAYYDVRLGGRVWPVSATWRAGTTDGPAASARSDVPRADLPTPPSSPFVAFSAEAAALGARVQVWPFDPVFPGLAALARHHRARGARVDVVRYRPGQRHVLRIAGGAGRPHYVKLAAGLDRAALDAVLATAAVCTSDRHRAMLVGPVTAPGPGFGTIAYPAIGAAALSSARTGAEGVTAQALTTLGELAAMLHRVRASRATDLPAALPTRSNGDELDLVARACQHVVALAPELGATVDQVVAAGRQAPTTDELRLVHGDLKLDHVLVTRDGIRLIDLDGMRLADPAIDIAKLRAELRFLDLDGGRPGMAAAAAALDRGYRRVGEPDVLRRAALLEPALLLRMAARRVSLGDERWRERVGVVVGHARRLADAADGRVVTP